MCFTYLKEAGHLKQSRETFKERLRLVCLFMSFCYPLWFNRCPFLASSAPTYLSSTHFPREGATPFFRRSYLTLTPYGSVLLEGVV